MLNATLRNGNTVGFVEKRSYEEEYVLLPWKLYYTAPVKYSRSDEEGTLPDAGPSPLKGVQSLGNVL